MSLGSNIPTHSLMELALVRALLGLAPVGHGKDNVAVADDFRRSTLAWYRMLKATLDGGWRL